MKKECRLNLRVNTGGNKDFYYNLSRMQTLNWREKKTIRESYRLSRLRERKELRQLQIRKEKAWEKFKRAIYYIRFHLVSKINRFVSIKD